MLKNTSILFILLSIISCSFYSYEHINISIPNPDASYEERKTAYEKLRPVEEIEESSNDFRATTKGATIAIVLNDKTTIFYPEDLAPLLPKDSKAAYWLNKYQKANEVMQKNKKKARWIALASGLAMSGSSVLLFTYSNNIGLQSIPLLGFYPLAIGLGTMVNRKNTHKDFAKDDFFYYFDEALQSFLHLCKNGEEIVDCQKGKKQQETTEPTSTSAPVNLME